MELFLQPVTNHICWRNVKTALGELVVRSMWTRVKFRVFRPFPATKNAETHACVNCALDFRSPSINHCTLPPFYPSQLARSLAQFCPSGATKLATKTRAACLGTNPWWTTGTGKSKSAWVMSLFKHPSLVSVSTPAIFNVKTFFCLFVRPSERKVSCRFIFVLFLLLYVTLRFACFVLNSQFFLGQPVPKTLQDELCCSGSALEHLLAANLLLDKTADGS